MGRTYTVAVEAQVDDGVWQRRAYFDLNKDHEIRMWGHWHEPQIETEAEARAWQLHMELQHYALRFQDFEGMTDAGPFFAQYLTGLEHSESELGARWMLKKMLGAMTAEQRASCRLLLFSN